MCFSPNVTERFDCLDSLGRALGLDEGGEQREDEGVRDAREEAEVNSFIVVKLKWKVEEINKQETDKDDTPLKVVLITDCGVAT